MSCDIEASQLTDTSKYSNNTSSYSQGSVVVNSQLIFNNASSVPETSVVVDTLVEAATNGSISIPVNTSSVVATSKS